jgi:hypothetical protein
VLIPPHRVAQSLLSDLADLTQERMLANYKIVEVDTIFNAMVRWLRHVTYDDGEVIKTVGEIHEGLYHIVEALSQGEEREMW